MFGSLPGVASAHAGAVEVVREARAAAAAAPADASARLQLARAFGLTGEWASALAALDAAAALGADADEVGAARGGILSAAGDHTPAIAEFDRVLARRPDLAAVRLARGRACLRAGDLVAAERDLGGALAALPQPRPEDILLRRDVLLALGRPAQAVAALDAGMLRIGRVAALQLAAVDLDAAQGRSDAALRRCDDLIAREGRNPFWLARRADLLVAAGRSSDARAAYADILTLLSHRAGARRAGPFESLRRRVADTLAAAPLGESNACANQSDAISPL